VRFQDSLNTVRAKGRPGSTPQADHLPYHPGADPIDLHSVKNTVSRRFQTSGPPSQEGDARYSHGRLRK
jgi:hypothetical protein